MKAPALSVTVVSLLLLEFSPGIFAGAILDPNFALSVEGGPVNSLVLDENGSIVAGGDFTTVDGEARARVARLNPNGTLDTTFAGSGANDAVHSVRLTGAGQLILGGRFSEFNGTTAQNLAAGPGPLSISGGPSGAVEAIALDASGRLIVGGSFLSFDGAPATYVARLTSGGTIDQSFSSALTQSFAIEAGVTTLATQPDGKIVVGGNFETASGFAYLARLNEDGTLDPSFNGDHGPILYPRAILPLANGQLLVAGLDSGGNGFVRRLNADRSVDAAFRAPEFEGAIHALAVDADGHIYAGGRSLHRLESDGSLDESWTVELQGVVNSLIVDADGKLLVGGIFSLDGSGTTGLARILNDSKVSSLNTNSNVFRATLRVQEGADYLIESSVDLVTWTEAGRGAAPRGELQVVDTGMTAHSKRFFRARRLQ